jgi:hypothetical protein
LPTKCHAAILHPLRPPLCHEQGAQELVLQDAHGASELPLPQELLEELQLPNGAVRCGLPKRCSEQCLLQRPSHDELAWLALDLGIVNSWFFQF